MFQTKLTYDMICYWTQARIFGIRDVSFQTKLTYDMICYDFVINQLHKARTFQTKLTYDMICYETLAKLLYWWS